MANIEKRIATNGDVSYRVKIRLKGVPTQTNSFSSITKAKNWIQKTETEIKEGRYQSTLKARKYTLGDLIDRYMKTVLPTKGSVIQDFKRQLEYWKKELGDCLLIDLTPDKIVRRRDDLASQTTIRGGLRSPATVNRCLTPLSSAINIAIKEWGWLEVNPMSRVSKLKEARGRVKCLDDNQRMRLLEICKESDNPCLYPVVILALSTGARKMEIMSLTWDNVNLDRGHMTFQETKNGERRGVSIAEHPLSILKEYALSRDKNIDWVFPSKDNSKPMDIRRPWINALKKAEISDFRFHDLRHSAASYLAMNGASLAEIAEILGHKTLQMVKRYAHLSEGHKKTVIESMNKKIFGE